MPSPVVVFHKNCLDGRSAAAVAKRFHQGRGTYRPMQYGHKLKIPVLGRPLWVLDFALDEDEMRRGRAEASQVVWLDHHASNAELQQRLGWGSLDTNECGASLTWQYCFPDEPLPPVLAYVKDKDLWQWKLPHSKAITAGLADAFSDKDFDGLLEADLDAMRQRGEPLVAAQEERVTKACRHGVPVQDPYGLRGVSALVVNAQADHSEIGDRVCRPSAEGGKGHDLAIMFFLRADGRWVHTLRSPGVDCARIALNRGGGGHPAAASYVSDRPFPLSDDCLDWPI